MKVFVAAPLFNEMEHRRNSELAAFVRELGFETFLAQDDVGLAYDFKDTRSKAELRKDIFDLDARGVRQCDIMLILLDGRTPDEGACVELGMAWALGKPCIAYKTDHRAMDKNGDDNIMIEGSVTCTARTYDELRSALFRARDGVSASRE